MNWLVFVFALQMGWTPNSTAMVYPDNPVTVSRIGQFYSQMDSELRFFNTFYAGGNLGVQMFKDQEIYFAPTLASYGIKAGVRFGNVEIGWSHLCQHPVIPALPLMSETLWQGSYDEFHVKISGSANLF